MNAKYDLIYENGMYDELRKAADKLSRWFLIDKVKFDAVYIWILHKYEDWEDDVFTENVFDIYADYLQFYLCTKPWRMPNEAIAVIHEVQEKLKEIQKFLED